jgi:hypothetical protein
VVTVSEIVVAFDKLPDVPVMVTVTVPVVAVLLAVSVNVLVVVAGFALNDAVTPLGSPDADKLTPLLKPFCGVTAIVLVPAVPCVIVKLLGEAERVKFGAGADGVLSDTLSKVAVASAELLPLFTANPTYTFCPMLIVWLLPSAVQFTPSVEVALLKLLPLLLTFTQYGRLTPTLLTEVVLPPVLTRSSKLMVPYTPQSAVLAFVDALLSVSRIITPADTYPEPPCKLTTRAVIVPSPDNG